MLNKVTIIGNLGNDPEIKTMQSGDRVANLSIATSESWKDKSSGERKTVTQWHKVVIFNQPLVKLVENYVKKGSKLYLEGQLETRSWDQGGEKKYATEVVLRPYKGEIVLLDSRSDSANNAPSDMSAHSSQAPLHDDLSDEIPF